MKKIGLMICALLGFSSVAVAGDLANFVNLGFSADNRFFMFGVYGINDKSFNPYAEIYLVDVAKNQFAANGARQKQYKAVVANNQNGLGALFNLMSEFESVKKSYRFDHLASGRLLYLCADSKNPPSTLDFADNYQNYRYRAELIQKKYGEGKAADASFSINLTINDQGGGRRDFVVGRPDYKRSAVTGYWIEQVVLAPNGKSLVFVVAKMIDAGDGSVNVRYMVETITFE